MIKKDTYQKQAEKSFRSHSLECSLTVTRASPVGFVWYFFCSWDCCEGCALAILYVFRAAEERFGVQFGMTSGGSPGT